MGEIVDGRRRYPLIVRYDRGFRDQKEDLENVRLSASSGAMIYVSDVADVLVQSGPAMISSDGSYPSSYVFVDLDTPDVGGYVEKAKKVLADISLPLGYSLDVVGEYESMKRVREGLRLVIPLALMIIVMMIYLNLRSVDIDVNRDGCGSFFFSWSVSSSVSFGLSDEYRSLGRLGGFDRSGYRDGDVHADVPTIILLRAQRKRAYE